MLKFPLHCPLSDWEGLTVHLPTAAHHRWGVEGRPSEPVGPPDEGSRNVLRPGPPR